MELIQRLDGLFLCWSLEEKTIFRPDDRVRISKIKIT